MRLVSLAPLLAAVLFAQSPPTTGDDASKSSAEPAAQPQAPKIKVAITPMERARQTEKLKEQLQKLTVNVVTNEETPLAPGQTCSIPLKNAMPRNAPPVDKAMILPAPSNPGRLAIRQVSPPAPPCDDVKR